MFLNLSYMLLEVEAEEELVIEEEEDKVLIIVTAEMILKIKRIYSRVILA